MPTREPDIAVIEKTQKKEKLQKPRMYKVIFINDDFTTLEFVVGLLMKIFKKTLEESMNLAQEIHTQGSGIAGVYTHEIAETKAAQSMSLIQQHEHPLMVTMEPE